MVIVVDNVFFILRFSKNVKLKCSHQNKTKQQQQQQKKLNMWSDVMDILINSIKEILSQCMHIKSWNLVYLSPCNSSTFKNRLAPKYISENMCCLNGIICYRIFIRCQTLLICFHKVFNILISLSFRQKAIWLNYMFLCFSYIFVYNSQIFSQRFKQNHVELALNYYYE